MSKSSENFSKLLEQLPKFCKQFFIGISQSTTELTRENYARDILVFFRFLKEETEEFAGMDIVSLPVERLDGITPQIIEQYLFYVSDYAAKLDGEKMIDRANDSQAKARKLCALNAVYRYFLKKQVITKNPIDMVDRPKIREKAIIRLDPAEVANMLDAVEFGYGQTEQQKKYNKPLVLRDVCMLTLFLGTGIRISECTGINISDIDFNEQAIKITRKGQKEDIVYFGDEVERALQEYLAVRRETAAEDDSKDALFLSNRKKRITNRAVENLVKKYAKIISPLKHITPHKLRSTFGTALYQETGDIYLVATVLGHKDVNTTRKHYAYQDEENKYRASKTVRLRTEKNEEKKEK